MSTKKSGKAAVKVAIVGTGGMAAVHAAAYSKIPGCRLVGACDVDAARAKNFAERHGIPAAYGSLDEMLAQCDFDAVSVVTPDAAHMPVTMACLRAGKHVLCEKPLALVGSAARTMAAAAKKARVVNLVNFSYRNWPCIEGAAIAIRKGVIGEIRHLEASYLQAWLVSKAWGEWRTSPAWLWRLSTKHGSKGVLGDVGVHILDYATYPVGPLREVFCRLKAFPKAPGNRIGDYVLDANDSATLNVEFANGALGVIHTTRWCGGHANRLALKISGTLGTISMDSDLSTDSYRLCAGAGLDKGEWKDVPCKAVPETYSRFISAIRSGGGGDPDFDRGAEIQGILDACFESDKFRMPVRITSRSRGNAPAKSKS